MSLKISHTVHMYIKCWITKTELIKEIVDSKKKSGKI